MRRAVEKSESLINKGAAFEDNYPQLPFPVLPGTVEVKSEGTLMSHEPNTVHVMEQDPHLYCPLQN